LKLKVLEKDGKIYSHIRKKWLTKTPEELVRQEYLLVLVNKYGYTLEQIRKCYRTRFCTSKSRLHNLQRQK
jgi:hypothetical protein